jgi:hypothetical protein
MKALQTRRHLNGQTSEIHLLRNGQFYAYGRPPNRPADEMAYGQEVRSLFEARRIADFMAHSDCEAKGCGNWQDVHDDDSECVEALNREMAVSGVQWNY